MLQNLPISPSILWLPRVKGRYMIYTESGEKKVGHLTCRAAGRTAETNQILVQVYHTTPVLERYDQARMYVRRMGTLSLSSYFKGNRFTVCTDGSALQWILNISNATVQPARWHPLVSRYDFDIAPRPGMEHQAPDALSLLELRDSKKAHLTPTFPCCLLCEMYQAHPARQRTPISSVMSWTTRSKATGDSDRFIRRNEKQRERTPICTGTNWRSISARLL